MAHITISDNHTPIIRDSMCGVTMENPGPAAIFQTQLVRTLTNVRPTPVMPMEMQDDMEDYSEDMD